MARYQVLEIYDDGSIDVVKSFSDYEDAEYFRALCENGSEHDGTFTYIRYSVHDTLLKDYLAVYDIVDADGNVYEIDEETFFGTSYEEAEEKALRFARVERYDESHSFRLRSLTLVSE